MMLGFGLNTLMESVAQRGLTLIDTNRFRLLIDPVDRLAEACDLLLSSKGEASGIAMAHEIFAQYGKLESAQKRSFFLKLLQRYGVDQPNLLEAAKAYVAAPDAATLARLRTTSTSRVQQLLERLNQFPDATLLLVEMRADLMEAMQEAPELITVDAEFLRVFSWWFNRGVLELQLLDWNSPTAIIEKVIRYEAVHEVTGWDDLRRRVQPEDRCIYGFFHPRLTGEPLIFVEVAMTKGIPATIDSILSPTRSATRVRDADTAVFYSISNCQRGLRGVPLGSFLIKHVVADLRRSVPNIRTFVTLSPVPGFARWLQRSIGSATLPLPRGTDSWEDLSSKLGPAEGGGIDRAHLDVYLCTAAAKYLATARDSENRVLDPVGRFHLGNGARLFKINPRADSSQKGMDGSLGVMVNYLYSLDDIEENHERLLTHGHVAVSQQVASLLRRAGKILEVSS